MKKFSLLWDGAVLVGVGLFLVGVWQICPPATFILGGLALVIAAVIGEKLWDSSRE